MSQIQLQGHYDEIVRLASDGVSDARIAKALPITVTGQQVYRFRQANQIEKAKNKWPSRLDPYADEIRRLYVEERKTDKYIADTLPVEVDADTVRAYRLNVLSISSNRSNRSSDRYIGEDFYLQIKDELPQVLESTRKRHATQNRFLTSTERVAEHYGIGTSLAYKMLKRAGLVDDRPTLEREGQQAKELFDQGLSVPRIAREIGQKEDSVRNWLNALGCDLSGHIARMSHEEKLAWRGAISDAKAADEDTTRNHPYGDDLLGSKYEVIAATQFDRVGLSWRPYSRLEDGVLDYEKSDGHASRYAPDLVVSLGGVEINVEVKGLYAALDQIKVRLWRKEKGKLALMQRSDILELEHATDAVEAFDIVRACCYNDPEIKSADWRQ